MVIIKNKFLKVTILLLILFISIGIACASQNNETDLSIDENTDNQLPIDDIANAINNTPDNGAIQLEKEYALNENKTMKINKSLTFNGVEKRTIIEGNGNYLNLDVFEKEPNVTEEGFILITLDDGLKNTGKHIIFNNITFKNIKLQTWHKMEFNDCEFIDSTFITKEMDNEFNSCIFNNSTVEIEVMAGYSSNGIPRFLSEFSNCLFYESELKTKLTYPPMYLHIVGGDFFRVYDGISLADCIFSNSKISLNNVQLNITSSKFNSTDIAGHSNTINIKDSEFSKQNIDFIICKSNFTNAVFNNSNINLEASYFSIGSMTDMTNCSLNNTRIEIEPGFRSRQSQIRIMDCDADNSYIDATDAHVTIQNSELNNTEISLCFSSLNISDSTISNNADIENTIKTKLQDTREVWDGEKYINKTVDYQIKTDYNVSNTYFVNGSGKFQLKSEDISKNTLYNFTYVKQEAYFINNELVFRLTDQNGNPVVGEKIYIEIGDDYIYPVPTVTTDETGTAKYHLSEGGNLTINAYYYSPGFDFYDNIAHSLNFNLQVKSPVDDLKVTKCNFKSITYSNIKSYLKLKLTSKDGKDISNIKLTIKLKSKKYNVYSDSKGNIKFKIPKNLDAGTYTLKIKVPHTNISKTIKFKVDKAKATVNAAKVTHKFKKSEYFKVTVKNNEKAVSKVKIKIKVYTGKKYRTYTVKTNKKGIAKINTKNLKVGTHKVVISSGNNNYKISAKSTIKIEK